MKRKLEEAYDLPYDMVFEIFSFLPAKQICKFRCANKLINNLTSTCNFSTRQSSNVKTACGLLVQDNYLNVKDLILLDDNEVDEDDSHSIIGVQRDFLSNSDSIIVGCNNGVVVYEEKSNHGKIGQLCAINPVTMQRRVIPRLTTNGTARILGSVVMQEGNDADYNLVCFLPTGDWGNHVGCNVYSSKENRWTEEPNKRLDVGSRNLNYERPIMVEKMIYFASDSSPAFTSDPYIVEVDVEQKNSKILPLPLSLVISSDDRIEIANWGDDRHEYSCSICVIWWCRGSSSFTIWTMEDRKNWTWSKTPMEITLERLGLERSTEEEDVTWFTLVNGDKLVFTIGSVIHVYGLKDGRRRRLKKEVPPVPGGYLSLLPYANTLCPC